MTAPQSPAAIVSSVYQNGIDVTNSDERTTVRVRSWLACQVAASMNTDFADVWDVMSSLPDAYLGLLQSPEGWSAISAIVAADLGCSSVPVNPAIH